MKSKLILILVAIISLASSRLLSQESCKVLLPSISNKYEGDCKNGLAQGKGIAEGVDKYEGNFKKGLPHGSGKYTWANGEVYDGKWKEGKKEGEGKFFYKKNGVDSVRVGIWKNDLFFKKITPKPYKVFYSNGVIRYTVQKTKEGSRVFFTFLQNGNQNTSVDNILFSPSSGNSYKLGNLQGFENVRFPFRCKITYSTLNSLKTMRSYVEFEIEITEPGEWTITLHN